MGDEDGGTDVAHPAARAAASHFRVGAARRCLMLGTHCARELWPGNIRSDALYKALLLALEA